MSIVLFDGTAASVKALEAGAVPGLFLPCDDAASESSSDLPVAVNAAQVVAVHGWQAAEPRLTAHPTGFAANAGTLLQQAAGGSSVTAAAPVTGGKGGERAPQSPAASAAPSPAPFMTPADGEASTGPGVDGAVKGDVAFLAALATVAGATAYGLPVTVAAPPPTAAGGAGSTGAGSVAATAHNSGAGPAATVSAPGTSGGILAPSGASHTRALSVAVDSIQKNRVASGVINYKAEAVRLAPQLPLDAQRDLFDRLVVQAQLGPAPVVTPAAAAAPQLSQVAAAISAGTITAHSPPYVGPDGGVNPAYSGLQPGPGKVPTSARSNVASSAGAAPSGAGGARGAAPVVGGGAVGGGLSAASVQQNAVLALAAMSSYAVDRLSNATGVSNGAMQARECSALQAALTPAGAGAYASALRTHHARAVIEHGLSRCYHYGARALLCGVSSSGGSAGAGAGAASGGATAAGGAGAGAASQAAAAASASNAAVQQVVAADKALKAARVVEEAAERQLIAATEDDAVPVLVRTNCAAALNAARAGVAQAYAAVEAASAATKSTAVAAALGAVGSVPRACFDMLPSIRARAYFYHMVRVLEHSGRGLSAADAASKAFAFVLGVMKPGGAAIRASLTAPYPVRYVVLLTPASMVLARSSSYEARRIARACVLQQAASALLAPVPAHGVAARADFLSTLFAESTSAALSVAEAEADDVAGAADEELTIPALEAALDRIAPFLHVQRRGDLVCVAMVANDGAPKPPVSVFAAAAEGAQAQRVALDEADWRNAAATLAASGTGVTLPAASAPGQQPGAGQGAAPGSPDATQAAVVIGTEAMCGALEAFIADPSSSAASGAAADEAPATAPGSNANPDQLAAAASAAAAAVRVARIAARILEARGVYPTGAEQAAGREAALVNSANATAATAAGVKPALVPSIVQAQQARAAAAATLPSVNFIFLEPTARDPLPALEATPAATAGPAQQVARAVGACRCDYAVVPEQTPRVVGAAMLSAVKPHVLLL
jgi:hypothetical protein